MEIESKELSPAQRGSIRYTKKQKQAFIKGAEESSLTIKEYAKSVGVGYSTLHAWMKAETNKTVARSSQAEQPIPKKMSLAAITPKNHREEELEAQILKLQEQLEAARTEIRAQQRIVSILAHQLLEDAD